MLNNIKFKAVKIWHILAGMCFLLTLIICISFLENKFISILLVLFFSIIILLSLKIINKIDFDEKILICFLLVAFFLYIAFVGYYLRVEPSWDFGSVYSEASRMVLNGEKHVKNIRYFLQYTNNQPYFFLLYILFSFASLFNYTDFLTLGIVFNALVITISLGIFYICVKKIWNKNVALFGLLLSFFCIAYLTYVPIFYTDTFPLPLVNLILLLYIYYFKDELTHTNVTFFLIGILIAFGFKLKATVIIMGIAIIIHLLFTVKLKKSFLLIIIFCLGIMGGLSIYNITFNASNLLQYSEKEFNKYNFPYTHWIMMALNNPGGFNIDDKKFTQSLPDIKTRKKENIKIIKQRIEDYGIDGMINHLIIKINYTWNDGSYFSSELLSRKPINSPKHFIQKVVIEDGKYNKIYSLINNSFHLCILIFVFFSFFFGVQEDKISLMSIIRLIIFGVFLFLLIWESKPKYLVNFIPIIYIVAIDGINQLSNFIKERRIIENV